MQDARPQLSYQVGSTPEGVERPRVLHDATLLRDIQNLPDDAKVRTQYMHHTTHAQPHSH